MVRKSDAEKLAALLGIEPPKIPLAVSRSESSRQAEAAILYAEGIAGFIRKDCKNCGLKFAHTPGAVAFCSDSCRAQDLARIGIDWDWTKPPEERWTVKEPLVVPPKAVHLIDEVTDVRDNDKCPVHNHMRDTPDHGSWCWGDRPKPSPEKLIPERTLDFLKDLGLD
jgi:hypothetical protein